MEDLSKSGRACLVVIKGRRRIGKSHLAEEFGKNKVFLPFSGLAPVKGVTVQDQRDAFARELGLEVIDAMKAKIASLAISKGFGISPILIHLGPISDALLSSRYFYRIIDIADL